MPTGATKLMSKKYGAFWANAAILDIVEARLSLTSGKFERSQPHAAPFETAGSAKMCGSRSRLTIGRGCTLQKKDRHQNKNDDDGGDRILDQPGESDPRSTMPFKFGIDRRHTFLAC